MYYRVSEYTARRVFPLNKVGGEGGNTLQIVKTFFFHSGRKNFYSCQPSLLAQVSAGNLMNFKCKVTEVFFLSAQCKWDN